MSNENKGEGEDRRPKLMFATPMYGGMCTSFYVHGLLEAINNLRELKVQAYWAQITNESLITRARNELVRVFLASDADFLMFIDADIAFRGSDVLQLLAADEDVVCGIYPKKEVDWKRVAQAAKDGEVENLADFGGAFVLNMVGSGDAETNEAGLIEIRHGGTGFMMINRRVFDALAPHVPKYRTSSVKGPDGEYLQPLVDEFFATSIDHTGALLSEDYHFCELWRTHGGKVFANPFIKLEHVGTYVYGGNLIRAGGNLK